MTMTNAEWMIENKIDLFRLSCKKNTAEKDAFDIMLDDRKIARIYTNDTSETNAVLAWLDMKHKEQILGDVERRYLADVIRPFRSRIIWIKKAYRSGNYEQIIIRMKSIVPDAILVDIQFPFFKGNEMYKGMNLGKEYTLEELGL